MRYNYAEKRFNLNQKNNIWASIHSEYDATLILNRAKSHVESIFALHPKDIVRVDEIEIEEALGELEIVIRKIEEFPSMFAFSDEVRSNFKSIYNDLDEKLALIAQRRTSW
ncbi:hypothetical protein [Paenibacillus sp. FSL H7-0331]|uniref:hypothetical protein n=1 Tax=Paenibacillus sp. FSL H7-0331 TaxID=1920421 RepID=UPI00096D1592|nr:hypothetical protein [Paenibacillus sp. FSL H7-0331]OME97892.1 hypothetical protein BK127_39940 [Paenibacillus sp. FSL H7-0331]